MKIIGSLLLSSISAEWNVWQDYEYCNYDQKLVAEEFRSDPDYSISSCTDFCRETTFKNANNYYWGDAMCCDFEKWDDGSYNCYVYEGK